ncbi:hypothetical protein IAE41_02185 [Stenotrophomonas sp. S39]|nr:hypothetical protein [Stenotrophomonas sp. S39]
MPSVRFAPPLKGTFAAVSISDDGCGIEASVMTHVFDPFFTTKGVGEGTGLGLSHTLGDLARAINPPRASWAAVEPEGDETAWRAVT